MGGETKDVNRYLERSKANRNLHGEILVFSLSDRLCYFRIPKIAEPKIRISSVLYESVLEDVRANRVRRSDDINYFLSINFGERARSVGLRHCSWWEGRRAATNLDTL